MNASILLHEEGVGVLNALSHIEFLVSFISSGKDIHVVQLCTLLAENIASLQT